MYVLKPIPSSDSLIVRAVDYVIGPLWLMNPNFLSLKSMADTHVGLTLAGSRVLGRTHYTDLLAVDTDLY